MQLQWAPRLEANPPVALQRQRQNAKTLAWDAYWTGMLDRETEPDDPHTRNTRAVTGHRVYGVDGHAGYVDNFIIDDQRWVVRYLVVSLGERRSQTKVVIEPHWVDSICWDDRRVSSRLPAAEIERLPLFHPQPV